MRRIAKLTPREISLTREGANRRVIATYKSKQKPTETPTEAPVSKAAVRGAKMTSDQLEQAIYNPPTDVWEAVVEVARNKSAQGKTYSPQAASIIKAMGRMLAPFSEELSMSDLAAIGRAAGLADPAQGAEDDAPVAKSKAKGEDEKEDDEDEGEEDQGDAMKPGSMNFNDDDEDDDSGESSDDDDEEDDEETDDGKPVSKSAVAAKIAPKGKSPQNQPSASPDTAAKSDEDEEEEDEEEDKTPSAQASGQPSGKKAKGENVAKSAHKGSADAGMSLEDIIKSHRQQLEENKLLKEQVMKTRKDLDEERAYRALESIKKSVRDNYGHLNVDADELAPVLKSLKDSGDDALFEKMDTILKSADKQVKAAQEASGIFTTVGKSSAQAPAAGATAEARIESRVDEEVTKSAGKLNRAQVYDAFIQTPEGRNLLNQHRKETRSF